MKGFTTLYSNCYFDSRVWARSLIFFFLALFLLLFFFQKHLSLNIFLLFGHAFLPRMSFHLRKALMSFFPPSPSYDKGRQKSIQLSFPPDWDVLWVNPSTLEYLPEEEEKMKCIIWVQVMSRGAVDLTAYLRFCSATAGHCFWLWAPDCITAWAGAGLGIET